jgi:hypothetical protein
LALAVLVVSLHHKGMRANKRGGGNHDEQAFPNFHEWLQ